MLSRSRWNVRSINIFFCLTSHMLRMPFSFMLLPFFTHSLHTYTQRYVKKFWSFDTLACEWEQLWWLERWRTKTVCIFLFSSFHLTLFIHYSRCCCLDFMQCILILFYEALIFFLYLSPSHLCYFNLGFKGRHCEENVDDCPGHLCQNGATCIDGVNTYRCRCPPNFTGSYCELDVDECATRYERCISFIRDHFYLNLFFIFT